MSLVMYSKSETEVTLSINYSAKTILLIKTNLLNINAFQNHVNYIFNTEYVFNKQ